MLTETNVVADITTKVVIGSGGAWVSSIEGIVPTMVGLVTLIYLGVSIYYKIADHHRKK